MGGLLPLSVVGLDWGLIEKIDRAGQAVCALLSLCASIATATVLAVLALNISPSMTALILAAGALLAVLLAGHRRKAAQVGEGSPRLTGSCIAPSPSHSPA